MAWHANDSAIVKDLKLYCLPCSSCDYCVSIGVIDGQHKNRCRKKPGEVFYTFVEKYCKQHSSVEWRLNKIEELNKNKNDGGARNR